MAQITLKGFPVKTIGELPKVGSIAPDFLLVDSELHNRTFKDYAGKKMLLSIDRKSTRLNSSHSQISYAVFCLKKQTHLSHRPPTGSTGAAQHDGLPDRDHRLAAGLCARPNGR